MTRLRLLCIVMSALLLPVASAGRASVLARSPQSTAVPIPQSVLDNWARLIGRWVADNSAYRSADDPNDAFGLEWSWGLGKKSLVGRLYGIQGGREAATFWEFREFWHPGEGRLVPMQFGAGGAVGTGWHELQPDGRAEMLQTFFNPGSGTVERVGHRSRLDGDRHVTESFAVSENGTWTPRRTYTWIRQPAGG